MHEYLVIYSSGRMELFYGPTADQVFLKAKEIAESNCDGIERFFLLNEIRFKGQAITNSPTKKTRCVILRLISGDTKFVSDYIPGKDQTKCVGKTMFEVLGYSENLKDAQDFILNSR